MLLRTKNLADCAKEKAHRSPDDIAIYLENGEHIRYGSIFEEAMALAASLTQLGLRPGDVISFQLPNWRETVAIDIAAVWLGLVINPVIPIYRDRELAFILADSRSRCLFIPGVYRGHDFPDMIERLMPQLPDLTHVISVRQDSDTCALLRYENLIAKANLSPVPQHVGEMGAAKIIMYTSGTTGRAKAVKHSHTSLARALDNGIEGWSLDNRDIMLMPSPVTPPILII